MQIGQVAAKTELSIATVRHYDEVGLVTPSARSTGGFRLYTEADVERLLVIRRMKPLGFSLAQMRDLLDAVEVLAEGDASDAEALAFAEHCRHRTEVGRADLVQKLTWADEFSALLSERLPPVST